MMLMTGVLAGCGGKNADKKDSASKAKVVKVGDKSIDEVIDTVSKSVVEKNKPEGIAKAGQDWLIFCRVLPNRAKCLSFCRTPHTLGKPPPDY